MGKRNYDLRVDVPWRDVLRMMEFEVNYRGCRAGEAIAYVQRDIEHNYPRELPLHMRFAVARCEELFFSVMVLNTLRRYLRYKLKTPSNLKVQVCYDFYEKYHTKD